MNLKDNMHYNPARRQLKHKRVGIYARVSSNTKDQLRSLANQVSALTQKVSLLSNEKYIGNVHLFKDNEYKDSYLAEDNHPAIISKYVFEKVQAEKAKRSNVVRTHDGVVRKKRRYKSKN